MNHRGWAQFVVESCALPLMPVILVLLFRAIGDTQPALAEKPILWNSEIPFFTWILGAITVSRTLSIAEPGDAEWRIWFALVAGATCVLSLVLMGCYFADETLLFRVPLAKKRLIGVCQLALAVATLFSGAWIHKAHLEASK